MLIIEYKESFSAVPDSTITVNNTFPGTGERFPGIHPTRPRAETTRWRNNFAGAHSEQRQHRPASRWEKILLENYRFILIYFLIDGRLATLQIVIWSSDDLRKFKEHVGPAPAVPHLAGQNLRQVKTQSCW